MRETVKAAISNRGQMLDTGSYLYVRRWEVVLDRLGCVPLSEEALDVLHDLVVMAQHRTHPRSKALWFIAGPVYNVVPVRGVEDRQDVVQALVALDKGETGLALWLIQRWVDDFPEDSGWAFDIFCATGQLVSWCPGISRRDVWSVMREHTTHISSDRPGSNTVYRVLEEMGVDGRLRVDYFTRSGNLAPKAQWRFWPTDKTPTQPNPFGLKSRRRGA